MNIIFKKGFSLFELMIAVGIVSAGLVMVYEAFFRVSDASISMPYYLKTQLVMDEMIWEEEERLRQDGYLAPGREEGEIEIDGKAFRWSKDPAMIDGGKGLYKIDIFFAWKSGDRFIQNSRVAYLRR